MIALMIWAALSGASPAAAHADTYFDTVGQWYAQGTPVTYDQMRGFYSGRCFSMDQKDIPRNTLLGYVEQDPSVDPGPGFPQPAMERKINSIIWRGQPEGIFDGDRDYDYNRRTFEDLMGKVWKTIGTPVDSPTLSFEVDWQADGKSEMRSEFRYYDSYLVVRSTALQSQRYVNGWTGAEFRAYDGDVINYCYYFKRLGL